MSNEGFNNPLAPARGAVNEELNGGCLDEREAFDRYWLARQRWLGFGKNLTDAEMLAYPDRREGEFHAWKAGRASLSTSKQAGVEHSQLMRFYGVDSVDALVAAQADHITKLQDRLPRNTAFTVQRVREG